MKPGTFNIKKVINDEYDKIVSQLKGAGFDFEKILRCVTQSGWTTEFRIGNPNAEAKVFTVALRSVYQSDDELQSIELEDPNCDLISNYKRLISIICLSRRILQTGSASHQIQDVFKLGAGAIGWQSAWQLATALFGSQSAGAYIFGQCILPGFTAMTTLNVALTASQWLLAKLYGDIPGSHENFKIVLKQLCWSVPPADGLWQPICDLANKIAKNSPAVWLLAWLLYHAPALLFSALQNGIHAAMGKKGFYSDDKTNAKLVCSYTAFGLTELLSKWLQSLGGNEIACNIFAAGVTTASGAGIFSWGEHQSVLRSFDAGASTIIKAIKENIPETGNDNVTELHGALNDLQRRILPPSKFAPAVGFSQAATWLSSGIYRAALFFKEQCCSRPAIPSDSTALLNHS